MSARTLLFFLLLGVSSTALAEEMPADNSTNSQAVSPPDETHPLYSADAAWAGGVIAAIIGLFLAASVIGPIVRAEAPQAVPAAMSHEEDPAADRHPDH
jgi:hypothetical protein